MKLRQARKILDISWDRSRPVTIMRALSRLSKCYTPAYGPPSIAGAVSSLRIQKRIEQQILDAIDAGSCFSAMTCTANNISITSHSLEEMQASMRELMNREVPVRMRVSPAAMEKLKAALPPAPIEQPSPFGFGLRPLHGLPVELDFGLYGFQAEIDHNSGRVEKLYEQPGDGKGE